MKLDPKTGSGIPKPTADRPQLPVTKEVMPWRMKGSKYLNVSFFMQNQSLCEWASKKPEDTLRPFRSMTLSALSVIEGATAAMRSSSIRMSPANASLPVPS